MMQRVAASLRVARSMQRMQSVLPAVMQQQRAMMSLKADGWLQVAETRAGPKFQNLISAGRHEVLADEPGNFPGGEDTGMNPYQFLLSGIGSCTSITVRLFADRNNIPLDKVTVWVKHDRIYAKDCQECQSKRGRVDVIDMHVKLEGDLTSEQRASLMEVANQCPVHKTLTSETLVHILPSTPEDEQD